MRIIGHGIHIVETKGIAKLMQAGEEYLAQRFTSEEFDLARRGNGRMELFLAGRHAAKEAMVRALGHNNTGDAHWTADGNIVWTDIEVLQDQNRMPTVRLCNGIKEESLRMGIRLWIVRISNAETCTIASAIATDGT